MTTVSVRTLTVNEVTFALRTALGSSMNWDDRIADMRRHRVYSGPILLPFGVIEGSNRPVYTPHDVAEFIKAYRKYDETAQANKAIQYLMLDVDIAKRNPHWRHNKLTVSKPH